MKVDNVANAFTHSRRQATPPSESQLRIINTMKQKLSDKGVDTSFLREAEDRQTATAVVTSLIRLCRKYGIRSD